jgi:hypothetical protein
MRVLPPSLEIVLTRSKPSYIAIFRARQRSSCVDSIAATGNWVEKPTTRFAPIAGTDD